jgi:hypothetical protein
MQSFYTHHSAFCFLHLNYQGYFSILDLALCGKDKQHSFMNGHYLDLVTIPLLMAV